MWGRLPPPTGLPRNEAFLIKARYGAVASEDKTCSEMGISILKVRISKLRCKLESIGP